MYASMWCPWRGKQEYSNSRVIVLDFILRTRPRLSLMITSSAPLSAAAVVVSAIPTEFCNGWVRGIKVAGSSPLTPWLRCRGKILVLGGRNGNMADLVLPNLHQWSILEDGRDNGLLWALLPLWNGFRVRWLDCSLIMRCNQDVFADNGIAVENSTKMEEVQPSVEVPRELSHVLRTLQ